MQVVNEQDVSAAASGAAPSAPVAGVEAGGARVLLRQVLGFIPGALMPAAVTLGSTVIFTRIFDSEGFGRYSLALSVALLLTTLANQWLQQGTGRHLPGAHAAGEGSVLKEAIGGAALAAGTAVALACAVAILLLEERVSPEWRPLLWPGAVLVVGTTLLDPLLVVLQSEMRARRYSMAKVVDVTLRLSLGLALVLLVSRTPAGLLWGNALAPLLLVPLLWRDARMPAVTRVFARLHRIGTDVRKIARYGLPLVGWFVASYTLNVSDRYVIQFFRGAGEVGIYAANYTFSAGIGGLMAAPVLLATHPLLMRAWDGGRRDVAERWLGLIVEWFVVAGVLAVGILAVFSADVARLLLGPEFREGHVVIPIAMAGAVAWQLGLYAQKPLEFEGRVRSVLWIGVAAAVLNVGINLLLVPVFGYVAAACSTVVSYVAYAMLTAWMGRRILKWRMRWAELGRTLAVCAGGLGVCWGVRAVVEPTAGYAAALAAAVALLVPTLALVAHRMIRPLLGRL